LQATVVFVDCDLVDKPEIVAFLTISPGAPVTDVLRECSRVTPEACCALFEIMEFRQSAERDLSEVKTCLSIRVDAGITGSWASTRGSYHDCAGRN
jgi:hypothetical protein